MMKKLLLIALICSVSLHVFAINDGETRTATIRANVSPSDIINIQAKHTELIVETWDKNEVEIVASVRFDGKMTSKMEEFLEAFEQRVNDKISSGGGELKIDTDLDIPNRVQIGSKNIGINISYGGKELKILYQIKAPGTNKYIISNSYEDVRLIGDFKEIDFTQYSGDLEADNIGEAEMNLKYGSATIKSITEADVEMYEQEFDVTNLGVIEMNAKYSELELKQVTEIEAVSYESDYEIGSIERMSGNYKYGQINVSNTIDQASFVFYEMNLSAENGGDIELENSKYSEFEFDKVNSITFEQSYEDETDIGTLGTFKSLNSKYGNHEVEILEGTFELDAYEDVLQVDKIGENVSQILISGKYIDLELDITNTPFILNTNIKYCKAIYDETAVEVRRYIKESDQLQLEIHSKIQSERPTQIILKGYEIDITLN